MQHNIVRKHRRTVSSINMGDHNNNNEKNTMSTFQDTHQYMNTQVSKPDFMLEKKDKVRTKQRAISDLIDDCTRIPNPKQVTIQELNPSINYKDPVFEFGRKKKLQALQDRKHLFKKSNTKHLDCIVQKSIPLKTGRIFTQKNTKDSQIQSQKTSVINRKTNATTSSLNKQLQKPNIGTLQKLDKKETNSLKKEVKKLQVKRNFKF